MNEEDKNVFQKIELRIKMSVILEGNPEILITHLLKRYSNLKDCINYKELLYNSDRIGIIYTQDNKYILLNESRFKGITVDIITAQDLALMNEGCNRQDFSVYVSQRYRNSKVYGYDYVINPTDLLEKLPEKPNPDMFPIY